MSNENNYREKSVPSIYDLNFEVILIYYINVYLNCITFEEEYINPTNNFFFYFSTVN